MKLTEIKKKCPQVHKDFMEQLLLLSRLSQGNSYIFSFWSLLSVFEVNAVLKQYFVLKILIITFIFYTVAILDYHNL